MPCFFVTLTKQLVKKSFLKDFPIKVINNGIDLSIFKPIKSDFRKNFKLEDKKIILGVATFWGKAKGLDIFVRLANELPKDYKVVLEFYNKIMEMLDLIEYFKLDNDARL